MRILRSFLGLVFVLILLAECTAASAADIYPYEAVIHGIDRTYLLSRPSTNAKSLTVISGNETVLVLSNTAYNESNEYYVHVRYGEYEGYLRIRVLDTLPPESVHAPRSTTTVQAKDETDDLLLRSGPGTGYEVIGYLFGGERLDYLGEQKNGWYHCSHYGDDCWISNRYVNLATWDESELYHAGQAPSPGGWYCFNCALENKGVYCSNCGAQKGCWICVSCYTWNSSYVCSACGRTLALSLQARLQAANLNGETEAAAHFEYLLSLPDPLSQLSARD